MLKKLLDVFSFIENSFKSKLKTIFMREFGHTFGIVGKLLINE
jgi:hypothetical protein